MRTLAIRHVRRVGTRIGRQSTQNLKIERFRHGLLEEVESSLDNSSRKNESCDHGVSLMALEPEHEWLAAARNAIRIEAASLSSAAERLDGELVRAVELILAHPGKVVVTGIGKSGHIARKVVATLCSTGTASVFLHPAEAVHGDLGIYTPGDPTVFI